MAASAQSLRRASHDEAPCIARLSRELIEHGLAWSWTPVRVLRAIGEDATNVVVMPGRHDVIGFGIMHYGEDCAHLALLGVQRAHQRQGCGARLLDWLLAPALAAGIASVRVEARADNPAALAFYERYGFSQRATVSGYYQGRIDAVRLERRLSSGANPPLAAGIRIEREPGLALYRLAGALSAAQAIAQISTAITLARAQGVAKLLILAEEFAGIDTLSVFERFQIGALWAAAAGERMLLAVVTLPRLIDPQPSGVTVARHRGAQVDVFASEQAARAWLGQRP